MVRSLAHAIEPLRAWANAPAPSVPPSTLSVGRFVLSMVSSARDRAAIPRRQHRTRRRELRCVRIVAVDAVVSQAGSSGKIPVAVHSPMAAMQVVLVLGSVALRAEEERVGGRDLRPVGEVEHRCAAGSCDVARGARERAVLDGETDVELAQVLRALGEAGPAVAQSVARDTGDADLTSEPVLRGRLDRREPRRHVDDRGRRLLPRRALVSATLVLPACGHDRDDNDDKREREWTHVEESVEQGPCHGSKPASSAFRLVAAHALRGRANQARSRKGERRWSVDGAGLHSWTGYCDAPFPCRSPRSSSPSTTVTSRGRAPWGGSWPISLSSSARRVAPTFPSSSTPRPPRRERSWWNRCSRRPACSAWTSWGSI